MVSDVAEGCGAEEGVGEGVECDVGVAVAVKALRVVYFDSADDEFAVGGEFVDIESVSYSEHFFGGV